ncbi:hypothetical protein LGR54_24270 [Ancylobacter sp. Lp-2]|uniref:hypothetical protein n=1 Tax=Ancylobacter sp. Lp-2 TaxID=2881339 RepID=UPI001E40154B|nr:hypothetical protein [Ancylobacter sp. Lp-2]MCB4771731.1 hypothetical protein [Ancylobacter sp. Lp-2]
MQSKWQALACYLGVAALCVAYLVVVPGVRLIDVCAGAGLGAALMWALNEWEAGRWRLSSAAAVARTRPAPARPRTATLAAPRPRAAPLPAPVDDPFVMATADTVWEFDDDARGRVSDPSPDRMPDWDATALAASLAKLHRELVGERGPAHAHPRAISLDLPPGAEFIPASRPAAPAAPVKEARVARLVLARPPAVRPARQPGDGAEPAPQRPAPPAFLRPKARRPR